MENCLNFITIVVNLLLKNFNALCSYVDSEYDKSCKKLGLKKRSLMYRCARHQYQNMFFLISDFIGHILVLIFLVSIAYILLIFYVTAIVTTFTSADNVERLALFLSPYFSYPKSLVIFPNEFNYLSFKVRKHIKNAATPTHIPNFIAIK